MIIFGSLLKRARFFVQNYDYNLEFFIKQFFFYVQIKTFLGIASQIYVEIKQFKLIFAAFIKH